MRIKMIETYAVDGVNGFGEAETLYLRYFAGLWAWHWEPPKVDLKQKLPNRSSVPDCSTMLKSYGDVYKVSIKYIPEQFEFTKIGVKDEHI